MRFFSRRRVQMSLVKWIQNSDGTGIVPVAKDPESARANHEVSGALSNSTSRKRGLQYSNYPPEIRAKIGKYACAHGTQPAVRKFTKDLGKLLSESTVRSMKKRYLEELSKRKDPTDVTSLEHKNRGQPLLVGKGHRAFAKCLPEEPPSGRWSRKPFDYNSRS